MSWEHSRLLRGSLQRRRIALEEHPVRVPIEFKCKHCLRRRSSMHQNCQHGLTTSKRSGDYGDAEAGQSCMQAAQRKKQ